MVYTIMDKPYMSVSPFSFMSFWDRFRKKEIPQTPEKEKPVSSNETVVSNIETDTNIKAILSQLNALYLLLSQHDKQIKQLLYELAIARRVMPTEVKDQIVSLIERLKTESKDTKAIIDEIVARGLCSRATAYRLVSSIETETKPVSLIENEN